ncbi:MAG TPA: nucleotide sugar dehydrogenase [Candidatus Limnocylindrales bacterium]
MSAPTATSSRSIAVVGAGYVGLVSAVGFAAMGHSVELVETDRERVAALRAGRVPFRERGVQEALTAALGSGAITLLDGAAGTTAGIALICVGTPIDEAGRADTQAVEQVISELAGRQQPPIVVVRSTLPVGTCKRLLGDGSILDASRFFTAPEFLRQGSALDDFYAPTRVIIGRGPSADPAAEAVLRELFEDFDAPLRFVTLEESELIKNGANAFLALKISFANEIAGLAERAGADAGPVLDGIALDPRIGGSMMHPSFGFGGSCLPKELATIAAAGRDRGLPMLVTTAAAEANLAQQRQFAERIDAAVGGVANRTIALLGLAFKAGTDDIRSSPAIGLAQWLVEHGAVVQAYDPSAGERARRAVPGIAVQDSAMAALARADAVVIATEWPEFADLDWAQARTRMATAVVIDGRRLLDPARMHDLGFDYSRVGTPSREPSASIG